jgi:8-oxo-dGTP diphosphatase
MNKNDLIFNVGFITFEKEVLMLLRNKVPNKGKWNGVGGHIEKGESPYQSGLREIYEESGISLSSINFGGILTWEGFEIKPGGLYIFTGQAPDRKITGNGEGVLAWKSTNFAFSDISVVDNIHIFLPPVLANAKPCHYHFIYKNGIMVEHSIAALPAWVDIHEKY